MSAIPAKIVLKSTTSKTLNDRFTEIARQIKSPPQVTLGGLRMGQMQQSQASSKNRRLAAQMANRPGVQAALGLSPPGGRVQNRLGNQNKGSVQGRLGSNKMTGFRPAGRGGQGGFRGGQGGVQQRIGSGRGGLRKGTGLKRGFGAGAGRGRLNRGGGMSRGVGRGMRGGMGGGRGKAQSSRGAGAARGRGAGRGGRGRGRGRGGQTNPVKSRDALDKELDEYMTQTKGHLDAELDQYMQNVATDD